MPNHLLTYYQAVYYFVTLKKMPGIAFHREMYDSALRTTSSLPTYLPNQPVNNSLAGCLINNVVGKLIIIIIEVGFYGIFKEFSMRLQL